MTTRTDDTQTHLLKLVRYAAKKAGVAASKRDAAIRGLPRLWLTVVVSDHAA